MIDIESLNVVTFKGYAPRGPSGRKSLRKDIADFLDNVNGIEIERIAYEKDGRAYVDYSEGGVTSRSNGRWKDIGKIRELVLDFNTERTI